MTRAARLRHAKSFDNGEGTLGQAELLGEVCQRHQVRSEPVPKPSDTGEGGDYLAVKAYWWWGGHTSASLRRAVLQWMSSVLGTAKPTLQAIARALIWPKAYCTVLAFVLYDMDAADNAKLSMLDSDTPFGRSM